MFTEDRLRNSARMPTSWLNCSGSAVCCGVIGRACGAGAAGVLAGAGIAGPAGAGALAAGVCFVAAGGVSEIAARLPNMVP